MESRLDLFAELTSSLHPGRVLRGAAPRLRRILPFERAALALVDPDGHEFEVLAVEAVDAPTGGLDGRRVLRAGTVSDHALARETRILSPIPTHLNSLAWFDGEGAHGRRSACVVPLRGEGAPDCVLELTSRSGESFAEHELPLLRRLGVALRAQIDAWLRWSGRNEAAARDGGLLSFEEAQRRHIVEALHASSGVIEGPSGAARQLGLAPSTLRNKMKRLGVRRPG